MKKLFIIPVILFTCFKSHLVNKKFISYIDHDGFAILKDGTKVEVSRRRKEEVMASLR